MKLGNMGTFSKLYGTKKYEVNGVSETGTCNGFCAGCELDCYVGKSYRYPSVIKGHHIRTHAMRENMDGLFSDIDKQLSRKRIPFKTVRINQSGEIETYMELWNWVKLAEKHTETVFYIYTKNYMAVEKILQYWHIPENFFVLISVWHEYGLKEYDRLKEHPQIKAFVYCDGFDYPFTPNTFCTAYNKEGKLNHELTCDKCRKCFDKRFDIIGCYPH